MKKKAVIAICIVILLSTFTVMTFAADPLNLIVNGKEIKPDVPPLLINGRTMAPVRWVAEALGADVNWDGEAVYVTGLLTPITDVISSGRRADFRRLEG